MKKIKIKGKVTGVFFRKFIFDNANSLNLKGYVKNINNDVEAVISGPEEKVNKLIEMCAKGPSGAEVDNVIVEDIKEEEFKEFEIRH